MANPQIVTVNITQTVAPTPSTLQQTGALISQGGTITAPNTLSLLTQLSDLTPLLAQAHALTSLTWLGSVVTATTAAPHGLTNGDTLLVTIVGEVPAGYNGTFTATVTGASTFTYPLASNPGAQSTAGTYIIADESELLAMATTFFAQGSSVPVYVLELGAGNANDGVSVLTAWLTANPNQIYSFLVPREWDGNANFLAMIADFEATTSRTYFWVTTTLQNYTSYASTMKDVFALIESPQQHMFGTNQLTALSWASGQITATTTTAHGVSVGDWFQLAGCVPVAYNIWYQAAAGTTGSTLVANVAANPGTETTLGSLVASTAVGSAPPATEFTLAAAFWQSLHDNPSSSNRLAPFAFRFVVGVTPWVTKGNSAILGTIKAASVNFVATGAEGGITNTMLFWGTTMDARDWTYWFSVDWFAINVELNIANAVMNGSNNPTNPLYYNQNGIDRLQDVAFSTAQSAVSFGLANGVPARSVLAGPAFTQAIENGQFDDKLVVNAVPFLTYSKASPGDYKIGKYAGLSAQYIPNRGFIAIVFNLNVTDFIVA